MKLTAAPDYETPGDANSDNVYEFNAVATNGSATDSLAMVVTVTDVLMKIFQLSQVRCIYLNTQKVHLIINT